jgi:hypothetical protein
MMDNANAAMLKMDSLPNGMPQTPTSSHVEKYVVIPSFMTKPFNTRRRKSREMGLYTEA